MITTLIWTFLSNGINYDESGVIIKEYVYIGINYDFNSWEFIITINYLQNQIYKKWTSLPIFAHMKDMKQIRWSIFV